MAMWGWLWHLIYDGYVGVYVDMGIYCDVGLRRGAIYDGDMDRCGELIIF